MTHTTHRVRQSCPCILYLVLLAWYSPKAQAVALVLHLHQVIRLQLQGEGRGISVTILDSRGGRHSPAAQSWPQKHLINQNEVVI
jgi:hypothetical protein